MNLTVRKTFHAPDGKGHAIAIFSLHMTRLYPLTSKIKLALRKIFLRLRADMTSSAWMMSARKSVNLEELLAFFFRICKIPLVLSALLDEQFFGWFSKS